MEFRHLRYLLAVADEMSFTRAAERLHVAQPALSVQIRQLENELGVDLFDRSRRAISLTDAGVVMVEEAKQLLRAADRTIELVQKTGRGEVGTLTVGFVPSASNMTLPPLLRAFATSFPGVELALREMQPDPLVSQLRDGRLDVGFLYLPFEDQEFDQRVVSCERFMVALSTDHRLAHSGSIDVADLRDDSFVMPARHGMPGLHTQVLDICRDAGFVPRAVQDDVWLVQTIVGLVAAGVGVAIVPSSARVLTPRGVTYAPLRKGYEHQVEMAAVWRRDSTSPVLAAFLSSLPQI